MGFGSGPSSGVLVFLEGEATTFVVLTARGRLLTLSCGQGGLSGGVPGEAGGGRQPVPTRGRSRGGSKRGCSLARENELASVERTEQIRNILRLMGARFSLSKKRES